MFLATPNIYRRLFIEQKNLCDSLMTSQQNSQFSQTFHSLIHQLHHCFETKNLRAIKTLHALLLRTGLFMASLNLHTGLISAYSKSLRNNLQTVTNIFNSIDHTNPSHFNAIVSDFSRHGFPYLALQTFSHMHTNGVPLDTYALCSSLTASTSIQNIKFGKQIHTHVEKSGWSASIYVGGALIDLYAKLSAIGDAAKVFDEIPMKNTVCVNTLLSGFAEAKMWTDGLNLIGTMHMLKMDYDRFTFSAVLRVCAGLSSIELGRQVHGYTIRTIADMEGDVFLQSSLVEMYGKCGLVEKAQHVFDLAGIGQIEGEIRKRDVVLWTSMLDAYGKNGKFEEVIGLFNDMLVEETKPDAVAFVAVISACGRTGHVSLGLKYFDSMVQDFKLEPGQEHYNCVVDLLCRAGELEKAWKLVSKMPFRETSFSSSKNNNSIKNSVSSISMWGALLSACMDSGNVEMGKLAGHKALELDPKNVGIYVLLSNFYARFDMWDEIGELRELMKERGLKKEVGCSWIEVAN